MASCPCAGTITPERYRLVVDQAVIGLRREPRRLLEPLERRMRELAAEQRFEEAADVRERAAALARALRRQRQIDALLCSGRLVIEIGDTSRAELHDGRLVGTWPLPPDRTGSDPDVHRHRDQNQFGDPGGTTETQLALTTDPLWTGEVAASPAPLELADELICVAAWLDEQAGRIRLVDAEHGLTSALPRLPSFEPRKAGISPRRGR